LILGARGLGPKQFLDFDPVLAQAGQ